MINFNNAVLRVCPDKFADFIGQSCSATIDDTLTLTFRMSDGLKTSGIRQHTCDGNIHTVITASGSKYVFEVRS